MSSTVTNSGTYFVGDKERIQFRRWTIPALLAIIVSLGAVLCVAKRGGFSLFGMQIAPLLFTEMIAVVNTVVFGALYFAELFATAKDPTAFGAYSYKSLWLVLWGCVAGVCLLVAFLGLWLTEFPGASQVDESFTNTVRQWARVVYIGGVLVSFIVFAWCDFRFARLVTKFRFTRTYWTLFAFGDLPTVLTAMFFAWFFYVSQAATSNGSYEARTLVSGALVAQMLFADVLVLTTSINLQYAMLRWLCGNCTDIVAPPSATAAPEPSSIATQDNKQDGKEALRSGSE